MNYEIMVVENGFILTTSLHPFEDRDNPIGLSSKTYVFNTAKELGEHIENNFKTLLEETNDTVQP